MKDEKETSEETLKVPADMLLEILNIIAKEGLKHEVVQVMMNRSLAVISVYYDKNITRNQKVINNIQSLLSDYRDFRESENEELNWREQ
ncbi:MAG TPA: hypothetical protein VNZ49_14215 [Bacteroidia bacterium]|jgi:hypothetical protein|nr:hypothetical protein [Bacteroidia bacterium]